MFKFISTLAVAISFSFGSNAFAVQNDVKLGLAYTPVASLPGAKVRTPGAIELLAIQDIKVDSLRLVNPVSAIPSLQDKTIDAWIGILDENISVPDGLAVKNLAWSASPVAIMRADTDIKQWSDLRNRTVCISKDSRFIGEIEHLYAAIENIYPTVTDALLALRTGECDASLQEESFADELLQYPEWQKFSARLQPFKNINLVEVQLAENTVGQQIVKLFAEPQLKSLVKDQAQDIAFEVYLDQVVPDCH